jgi:hypothetical protein
LAQAFAQQSLQPLLDQLHYSAPANTVQQPVSGQSSLKGRPSQLFKLTEHYRSTIASFQNKQLKVSAAADTIIVGFTPNDTLKITGTYNHNGPIWVIGTGVLKIHKANMTNLGDLVIWGSGKALIDSSTLNFPQNYFYERSIILAGNAYMNIKNTTMDYGGLSHGFTVTDSAKLVESKMNLIGFTTTGISGKGSIAINGTNQAGEFIIYDRCNLDLKNSTEVLLWHQFPDTAVINWSFGTSDTAYNYQFNKTKIGVKGVEYNVKVDSCYKMMWGMMPSSASKVTINNSKIRAIGLWFDHKNDSVGVNGIFDSTYYAATTIPLTDRVLKLNNTYVQTWSFYTFNNVKISVSNCQAGEIGAQQTSRVYGNGYKVDGTGGYHWTTDSAVAFANNLVNYSYVRSEKNSVFIVGYSLVVAAEAISKSILFVVQTTLMNDPIAREGAVAWYDNINQPAQIYTNSTANIFGSAWIDRGPTSILMDFDSWRLYYQKQGDVTWKAITPSTKTEVRNNLLGAWNTNGLPSGIYILRLNLKGTWNDSVDAFLAVNVLPGVTGTKELNNFSDISIYPNPATENVTINFTSAVNEKIKIIFTDLLGKQNYVNEDYNCFAGNNNIRFNTESLSAGAYLCRIITTDGTLQKLIQVKK